MCRLYRLARIGIRSASHDLSQVLADTIITHTITSLLLKGSATDQQTRIVDCVAEPGYGCHLMA
ncbi:MAG: hypothetical protein MRJ96_00735 [Nitrospirales bacterium]|nr:hypothetical protein [Nitrospirales bacterium]